MSLTPAEIDYLATQKLGRLATVAPDGSPQVAPTGFRFNAALGTIDIGGHSLSRSKKFRNIAAGSRAAFVVDDIASVNPWRVRGLEVRGTAEALTGQGDTGLFGAPGEMIRIHPTRVLSWGIEPGHDWLFARDVTAGSRS